MKKFFTRQAVLRYLYTEVAGNFVGFLIGASAAGLLSRFFETRSIRNLWGLAAKRTVVDKNTFTVLEWIISIVIGFVVFEIFTKVIAEWLRRNYPHYKFRVMRWIIKNNLHHRSRAWLVRIEKQRIALFTAVNQTITKRTTRK
ncbi:MAG TPA: hypothetical protein VFW11_12660 [Cyclobacteriaceae bacterium]|nr:hypothetical protein [Cyclobacteriaceae bacterium]